MTDGFDDIDLSKGAPLTDGAQIARLLGRIETTLIDMRRDIQENTHAQADLTTRLSLMDRRVGVLENDRQTRIRYGRMYGIVAMALLVPSLNLIQQIHGWFVAVNDVSFSLK